MTLQEDILKACEIMRNGGIILYPTDTVWGIGCDATCSAAVQRIYALKKRSDSKAMISLVGDTGMLQRLVGNAALRLNDITSRFNKPVTVIYGEVSGVCPDLLADNGSCAIRVTSEVYSNGLCTVLGHPVVSTSANISGEPTPSYFGEISQEILKGVDYVAHYRRDDTSPHEPSAVILAGSTDDAIKILRP